MRVPIKLNPTAVIVDGEGRFTRDGFNLLSDLIRTVATLETTVETLVDGADVLPGYADTEIEDAADDLNTVDKVAGRMVFDTVNQRIMVATGADDTDDWAVADGSATVTPA